MGGEDRTEFGRKKPSKTVASLRQTQVKIFLGKLPTCGATQIIRNGLIKM